MSFDDSFELGVLVTREEEKPSGLRAHPFVVLGLDGQLLRAVRVGALANEHRSLDRAVAHFQPRDVLVDLAEESLIACSPLLPE